MSLVLCPECGTKISDKATTCPHCGYYSADKLVPISKQESYYPVPLFQYDIEEWCPNRGNLTEISYETNRQLYEFFGKIKNIKAALPALGEAIKSLAQSEKYLVADYDKYIAELIDKGVLRFSIDKNGEILPTIRGSDGIVKMVRLKEVNLNPQMAQSLNNLAVHAQLAQILDEIEYIGDAIRGLHKEFQNDRLALAESAWDKLLQARHIRDSRLREYAILGVISTATDAKRALMRNYTENYKAIEENSHKSLGRMALEAKMSGKGDSERLATDSFQDLIFITNSVQVECEGYAMLGEYEACRETLMEFRKFVLDNRLNNRNTLIRINESAKTKQIDVVEKFVDISSKISKFDPNMLIDYNARKELLTGHETEKSIQA